MKLQFCFTRTKFCLEKKPARNAQMPSCRAYDNFTFEVMILFLPFEKSDVILSICWSSWLNILWLNIPTGFLMLNTWWRTLLMKYNSIIDTIVTIVTFKNLLNQLLCEMQIEAHLIFILRPTWISSTKVILHWVKHKVDFEYPNQLAFLFWWTSNS